MAIRGNTISANAIMKSLQLKGEDNFRKRYLVPSIENGYVQMLYPEAPKRPDQAYYLTEKGLALYAGISKEKTEQFAKLRYEGYKKLSEGK